MPLGDSYPECGQVTKAERCRPDYEAMISRQREEQSLNERLMNTLFEYVDFHGMTHIRPNSAEGILASFIGVLACDIRRNMRNVERMIKEQEQYDAEEERRKQV